ncbi:hypothetical protein D9M68_502750 [compost metagenome]
MSGRRHRDLTVVDDGEVVPGNAAEGNRSRIGETRTGNGDHRTTGRATGVRGDVSDRRSRRCVVIEDSAHTLAVDDRRAGDVCDIDEECLVRLKVRITERKHCECGVGRALADVTACGIGCVVARGVGGAVCRRNVEGHAADTGRFVQRYREGEARGAGITLGLAYVIDRQLWQRTHRDRDRRGRGRARGIGGRIGEAVGAGIA